MLSKAVYRIAQANNNVKKLKCLNTSKSVSTMWLMPHQGFQCGNSTKLKSFDIEDEEHNKGDMHMLYTNNRKCEETSNSPGKIRGSTRRDRDAGLRTPSQPASPPLHKTTTPRRRESILAYKHMTHTHDTYILTTTVPQSLIHIKISRTNTYICTGAVLTLRSSLPDNKIPLEGLSQLSTVVRGIGRSGLR